MEIQPSRRTLLTLGGVGAALAVGGPLLVTRLDDRAAAAPGTPGRASATDGSFFTGDRVHDLVLDLEDTTFTTLLSAWRSSGAKEWAEIGVELDGTRYQRAGLRFKGHSTLDRTPDDAAAQEYPWLIRLDKYVDGQAHHGVAEFVIRTNNSASSLNEPVALDLLAAAGLVSQAHSYARVCVGGSGGVLRVVVENPGDAWVAHAFPGPGLLYKAESSGDYSYRGGDPAAYDQVFDQESGPEDLTPLIAFLDLVNNTSDAQLPQVLREHLDVDAFATYLAFEDLVDNYDAIDGPGNNSYLWWDRAADRMTVVGWDHNLTFGVSNRPGATAAGAGGAVPGGGRRAPAGRGGAGPRARVPNPLVARFEGQPEFAALVTSASTALREKLFGSGLAAESLGRWASLLRDAASDLVPAATLETERAAIAAYL